MWNKKPTRRHLVLYLFLLISFSLFRKSTTTDIINKYLSNHPQEYTLAAYTFLINRMHILPLNRNRRGHEWQTILQIAKNNHFPMALIHKLKHRMTQERKQYTPLPPLNPHNPQKTKNGPHSPSHPHKSEKSPTY